MRKLNVLMIANDNQVVDRRILQEAQCLIDSGLDVRVVSGFEAGQDRVEVISGVNVERFMYHPKFSFFERGIDRLFGTRLGMVARFLKRAWRTFEVLTFQPSSFERFVLSCFAREKYDIIHVHDMPMLKSGVLLARAQNAKLVYDAHELFWAQSCFSMTTKIRMIFEEFFFIRKADVTITVNRLIANAIRRLYFLPKIEVLMNAAPVPKRAGISLNLREVAGIPTTLPIALFQGWFSEGRGLEDLIQVGQYLKGKAYIVLVGYGGIDSELRDQVVRLGLQDVVKFLGRRTLDELESLTSQATVGVIPYLPHDFNTANCSPNKLFEFIASGIPIATNRLTFVEEFVGELGIGRSGQIRNHEEFAAMILSVIGDLANESFLINCSSAQGKVGWEVEQKVLLRIYRELSMRSGIQIGAMTEGQNA